MQQVYGTQQPPKKKRKSRERSASKDVGHFRSQSQIVAKSLNSEQRSINDEDRGAKHDSAKKGGMKHQTMLMFTDSQEEEHPRVQSSFDFYKTNNMFNARSTTSKYPK